MKAPLGGFTNGPKKMKGSIASGSQASKLLALFLLTLMGTQSCGPGKDQKKDDGSGKGKAQSLEKKSDLEKRGLNGDIKKFTQKTFKADTNEKGAAKKVGSVLEVVEVHFNPSGMETREVWSDSTGQTVRTVEMKYENERKKERTVKNKGGKRDKVQSKIVWKYNGKRFPVKKIKKGSEGKVEWQASFEYDSTGRKVRTVRMNAKGKKIQELKIERNEAGHIVEKRQHSAAGVLESRTKFVRDQKGRVARKTNYNQEGVETGRFSYEYNDKGDRTVIKKFNEKGALVEKLKYKYEYDRKGNWTRRVTLKGGSPYRITIRSYSYR